LSGRISAAMESAYESRDKAYRCGRIIAAGATPPVPLTSDVACRVEGTLNPTPATDWGMEQAA
jgi:hypothetical protein